MRELCDALKEDFKDKEVRHIYCGEFLNSSIATQIKVLREQRGLTQTELANLAGMKQSRIATIEDVNYSSWSISTLKRIAEAFDLALTVQFDSFGSKLSDIINLQRETLERSSFDDDPLFQESLESEFTTDPEEPFFIKLSLGSPDQDSMAFLTQQEDFEEIISTTTDYYDSISITVAI